MFKLSREFAIDLGTANVLIYEKGKGIVLHEPSVVAVDKNDGRVIKAGADARNMLGRTPGNVEAVRPMRSGAISDYDMTEKLLSSLLRKVTGYALIKPLVLISVPSGITEVEERAVIQAAMEAGARRAYLMEEPLAAALGARLDISGAKGKMVVNVGGGMTDLAILTMGGVASSSTIRVGGDTFDEAVIAYVRKHYGILMGENTAESVKIAIGGILPQIPEKTMAVKGRDVKTGLPREIVLSSEELTEVFKKPMRYIVDEILAVMEKTSPELVADLKETGIVLTGGGCQLYGMADAIAQRTELPCRVAESPETCVVLGCGKSLRWLSSMQQGAVNLARRKLLREKQG